MNPHSCGTTKKGKRILSKSVKVPSTPSILKMVDTMDILIYKNSQEHELHSYQNIMIVRDIVVLVNKTVFSISSSWLYL